LNHTRKKFKT